MLIFLRWCCLRIIWESTMAARASSVQFDHGFALDRRRCLGRAAAAAAAAPLRHLLAQEIFLPLGKIRIDGVGLGGRGGGCQCKQRPSRACPLHPPPTPPNRLLELGLLGRLLGAALGVEFLLPVGRGRVNELVDPRPLIPAGWGGGDGERREAWLGRQRPASAPPRAPAAATRAPPPRGASARAFPGRQTQAADGGRARQARRDMSAASHTADAFGCRWPSRVDASPPRPPALTCFHLGRSLPSAAMVCVCDREPAQHRHTHAPQENMSNPPITSSPDLTAPFAAGGLRRMHLYSLTLAQPSQITHAINGNFSGTKQQVRRRPQVLPRRGAAAPTTMCRVCSTRLAPSLGQWRCAAVLGRALWFRLLCIAASQLRGCHQTAAQPHRSPPCPRPPHTHWQPQWPTSHPAVAPRPALAPPPSLVHWPDALICARIHPAL